MSDERKGKGPHDPVIIDGVRTPFRRSNKTYEKLVAYDLGRMVLAGLMGKTGIDPASIEHTAMGTVIHDPKTPNIARECVLGAGLPATIACHTVSLACISSNMAATTLADMVRLKRLDVAIFGGVDTCSDPPIRVSPKMRHALVRLGNMKKPQDFFKQWSFFKTMRFSDLSLDIPQVVEFSNGRSMGEGAELLAQQLGITREASDAFALRSHQLAVKAQKEGIFADDMIPVHLPPKFTPVTVDDGPREDSSLEGLARLRPAFDRKFGIATAGNSSFLTDGASAVLMMSRQRAQEMSYTPKAVIRDYVYRAGDALCEMLSGPSLTVPILLARNNLKVDDIGVWEIHEAFASQVLANIECMKQDSFAQKRLGLPKACGEIPLERINVWGGSLSIGHPFGATGGRLLLTAAKRIQREGQRFAVVTGCAAGGHGSAILLENPDA